MYKNNISDLLYLWKYDFHFILGVRVDFEIYYTNMDSCTIMAHIYKEIKNK